MTSNLIAIFISFLTAILVIFLLRPLAFKLELLDAPGGRKQHAHHTPVVGGVAMFIGLLAGLLLPPHLVWAHHFFFIIGGGVLVFFGLIDDHKPLSARLRFLIQILSGLIMTLGAGVTLHQLGNLLFFHDIGLSIFAVPITLFGVVIIVNAINFLDSIDGLAGSMVFVIFGFLAFLAWYAGLWVPLQALLLLMAALLAYLSFNLRCFGRKAALIFMGDSGSIFLGFAIVWFSIHLSQGPGPIAATPVTFLWFVAIPIYDVLFVTLRRLKRGQSALEADRSHLPHLFEGLGFSVNQTVFRIVSLVFLTGLIGVLGYFCGLPEGVMFLGFFALFLIYAVVVNRLWKRVALESPSSAT